MPNTYDQFGQPIVMMPYPPPLPSQTQLEEVDEEVVPIEKSDNLVPEVENQTSTDDTLVIVNAANESEASHNEDLFPSADEPAHVR